VILIAVGVFWIGFFTGYFARKAQTQKDYGGTIVIDRDKVREKTVYSLVLDDYPEKLEFKKEVIFKVAHPEEESGRK
jgi:hypothetical protein